MSEEVYDLLTDPEADVSDPLLQPHPDHFIPPEGSNIPKGPGGEIADDTSPIEIYEAIIGTNEIVDHGIVSGLIDRGRSVAKIKMPGHKSLTKVAPDKISNSWQNLKQQDQLGNFVGTGWILGSAQKILLTNHHVLPLPDAAQSARLEFGYQRNVLKDTTSTSHKMVLDPDSVFVTSPVKSFGGLDYTAVALSKQAPEELGFLDYNIGNTALQTAQVYVVQYPAGDPKSYSVNHNRRINLTDKYVTYTSDTRGGSSGSPLFDDDLNLIGIHHIGNNRVQVGKQELLTNLGSRIEVVIADLAGQLHSSGWDAAKVEEWFGDGSVLKEFNQI